MGGFFEGQQDFYGILRQIIKEETKWLRHYQGKVVKNQDPNKRNRVCVIIPELNMMDEDSAFWAFPRDINGMSAPAIGAFVEIYFMNGDPSRPVYMGTVWEATSAAPVKNYDGKPTTHVLFEDPKAKEANLKYSEKVFDFAQILALDVAKKALTILEGTEPFVLGNQLKIWLDAHVHNDPVSGSTTAPTIPLPSTALSTVIKGK